MLARAAGLLVARAARHAAGQQGVTARAFSAAAAPPTVDFKLPEAPLKDLSGQSASIATFVWQLACKENQLEKVQDELRQMVAAFEASPELARIAVDPFVPIAAKKGIFSALMQGSGASPITARLFVALAEENALSASLLVSEAFDALMLAHRKEVHCTIVTPAPLDRMERDELTKRAAKFAEPGYRLVMDERVDPKLLGGFVLRFEDRLVDMSVAKKLEEFNNLVFKLEGDA